MRNSTLTVIHILHRTFLLSREKTRLFLNFIGKKAHKHVFVLKEQTLPAIHRCIYLHTLIINTLLNNQTSYVGFFSSLSKRRNCLTWFLFICRMCITEKEYNKLINIKNCFEDVFGLTSDTLCINIFNKLTVVADAFLLFPISNWRSSLLTVELCNCSLGNCMLLKTV